jgi:hypothetical protein
MKKSELKQLIKEEIEIILNKHNVDEGWKENVLAGLMMLAGTVGGLKAQDMTQNTSLKSKTETSNPSKESSQVLIGYLIELNKAGGTDRSIEELGAIKEARIYLENIRDNKTPQSLSKPAKTVLNYAIEKTKNLDGGELKRLSDIGKDIKTINYNG